MTFWTADERLAAADKTIAALMKRVEGNLSRGVSAFEVLETNVALERIVAEKTERLESQRKQLQVALTHLQATQTELVQAQKLESVGRLASGIAHEINTPVQFVSDSLHFIRDAFTSLTEVVASHQRFAAQASEGPVTEEMKAALREAEEAADLTYLQENVPQALERAIDGLERVATLVRSMKEFAHADQKEKRLADLNRAILNTLTIATNEYKYVATVETDFGELPPLACHINELNQVILNLVVNAAHAIGDKVKDGALGKITVRTRCEGDHLVVSVTDTGTGIPEEIRAKVFDPFFTTKEIGKGSGQGLAIARSVVVDKHGGTLTLASEVGRGTTFTLRLPLQAQAAPAAPAVQAVTLAAVG
jgi:signal transduction histidine kinase